MKRPPQKPPWIDDLVRAPDRLAASVRLGTLFVAAPELERNYITMGYDFGVRWEYPPVLRLACTRGEHGSSRERCVATLVLHGLERKAASREELMTYCAVYNSCLLAGLSADAVFGEVAMVLPEPAGTSLRDFAARSEPDKALAAFRMSAQRNADGEFELSVGW